MDERIEAVQRMQDYIESNLEQDISMADLSKAAGYSPWYSYRLFQSLLHMTPAVYIRRLRLSKSALRLRDEKMRIIDVAYDSGFESVDGYQRAFYREFGCNPYEYSVNPMPIYLFKPYGVKYSIRKDSNEMSEVKSVFVQIVEKPARKVIIKRGKTATDYFGYCEEVGCDVWGTLLSMDSLCGEPVCLWLPERYIKPGTSKYVQGVEQAENYDGAIPEGFDIIDLPEAEYLMFQGEPYDEEDYCEAIASLQQAMNGYDPSVIGYEWDDSNPRIQLEPRGERGYIELRAVKRK